MNQNPDATSKASLPPRGVCISGTGMAIPPRILTNSDLEKMVDTSDQWIVKRTGIRERHLVDPGVTTLDLATEAVEQALGNAKLSPTDLDLLIVATTTPEMCCPATACRVVDRIGAIPCGAMDISVACTGFIAGLNMATSFINSGMYKNIAVVGAETLSSITNWKDRGTCILFGDGAGAAILSACDDDQTGCLYQALGSDGSKWDELYVPRCQADIPEKGAEFSGAYGKLHMNGREIYKFAVVTLQRLIRTAIEEAGLSVDQIKMVVPHQSNSRILESARDKMGFDVDKFYINIDRYGNTSSASVGICLHELISEGKLEKGDYVVFVALGGGLTWGSSVWRL